MTFQKKEFEPQNSELYDEIATLDAELMEVFESQLSISPFLSRKIVSFQGNKGRPAYGWYKYKEAFSAGLVEYFLDNYEGCSQGRLLDPFAGIGTSLFAASENGIHADGIELLPIGQELIQTRILLQEGLSSDDTATLERWVSTKPWEGCEKRVPFSTIRITEGAYPSDTVDSIERYRGALLQENEKIQAILRLTLLCVLESISYTRKDGQYLRWDARSGRMRPGTKPFNKGEILPFALAVITKLKEIISFITSHQTPISLFSMPHVKGDIRLFSGSCLEVLPTLDTMSYTSIITSPPYCNRYDYTRTYALELAMLGLTHEELCGLRQEMLSCTVENREKNLLNICPEWETFIETTNNQKLLNSISTYLEYEKSCGKLNNNSIPRMVRGYFTEMACVIGECYRVLKPNSHLIMVNDNVRYAGIGISVDLILSDIASALGFEVERILIVPGKKGNSSQQMGTYGCIPLRKCVYVWRKN